MSIIFELLDKKNCQIQKLELLQCIPLILQHAAKYTYLVSDLEQYLTNIVRIVNDGQLQNQINAQKQIFLIIHEFIRNVSDKIFILLLLFFALFYFVVSILTPTDRNFICNTTILPIVQEFHTVGFQIATNCLLLSFE